MRPDLVLDAFFTQLSKRFEIEKMLRKTHKYLIYSELCKWYENMFYNMFFAIKIWILRSNFVAEKREN